MPLIQAVLQEKMQLSMYQGNSFVAPGQKVKVVVGEALLGKPAVYDLNHCLVQCIGIWYGTDAQENRKEENKQW